MAKQTTPVPSIVPPGLSATDTAALCQYGQAFSATFSAIDLNVQKVQGDAESLAIVLCRLGADKDYGAYVECRAAFLSGLDGKSEEAKARTWTRAYSAARETKQGASLPKGGPASSAPAAQAKAAQRETAKTAAAADTRTVAELMAAAGAALSGGDVKEGAKLAALAKQKTTQAEKAAADAVKDKVAPMLERITAARDAMKKAGDVQGLTLLARVADALAAGQHAKVAKLAKALG